MKRFSRLRLLFDRSFSDKWWKQVVMLSALLAGLLLLLWGVALAFKRPEYTSSEYLQKILGYFFDSDAFHRDTESVEIIFPAFISLVLSSLGMILFGGLLVSIIVNIWERKVERIRMGEVSYRFSDHYVIFGYNDMVPSIIKQMNDKHPGTTIVLQTEKDADRVRNSLSIELSAAEMKSVIFMHGSAESKEFVEKLYLADSKRAVVLGDDDSPSHDSRNLKCVDNIVGVLKGRVSGGGKLRCDVLFDNSTTFTMLQKMDVDRDWHDTIDFWPFDFHETWARKVIVHNGSVSGEDAIGYVPLDGAGVGYESGSCVHLVIVGMNGMGFAMGLEAARTMHFPNFVRDGRLKTRITFVDRDADREMNYFVSRYRGLFEVAGLKYVDATGHSLAVREITDHLNPETEYRDFLDVEFCFVKGGAEEPSVRKLMADWACDESSIMTVAICSDDTSKAVATGLFLPDAVFDRNVPVLIQQDETNPLFTTMMPGDGKYRNIRPFGMVADCFGLDTEINETRAMRIKHTYDTYYRYRDAEYGQGMTAEEALLRTAGSGFPPSEEMQTAWRDTKNILRWANLYNADTIPMKIRSLEMTKSMSEKEKMELFAEVEHNRWNVERLLLGFRATTRTENEKICADRSLKEVFKRQMAHFDIRPYTTLDYDRTGARADEYDIVLSECFAEIVNVT